MTYHVFVDDKNGAQHGAAARAYDCLSLRKHEPKNMNSVHLGHEEPYMTENDAPPLPSMPDDIRNKIDAQRQRTASMQAQKVETKSTYHIVRAIACQFKCLHSRH